MQRGSTALAAGLTEEVFAVGFRDETLEWDRVAEVEVWDVKTAESMELILAGDGVGASPCEKTCAEVSVVRSESNGCAYMGGSQNPESLDELIGRGGKRMAASIGSAGVAGMCDRSKTSTWSGEQMSSTSTCDSSNACGWPTCCGPYDVS